MTPQKAFEGDKSEDRVTFNESSFSNPVSSKTCSAVLTKGCCQNVKELRHVGILVDLQSMGYRFLLCLITLNQRYQMKKRPTKRSPNIPSQTFNFSGCWVCAWLNTLVLESHQYRQLYGLTVLLRCIHPKNNCWKGNLDLV